MSSDRFDALFSIPRAFVHFACLGTIRLCLSGREQM
jgi:hypothetical protein